MLTLKTLLLILYVHGIGAVKNQFTYRLSHIALAKPILAQVEEFQSSKILSSIYNNWLCMILNNLVGQLFVHKECTSLKTIVAM